MPTLGRRTWQVLGSVLVVLLTLAVWWMESDDGHGVSDRPAPAAVSSAATPDPTLTVDSSSDLPYVELGDLPVEAAETVRLIDAGGPFPYPDKDGSTFGNYEGLLPDRDRGYYAEYTVPTPGFYDRGARRIIAGDGGELYWTEDHYESFERIAR